MLSLEPAVLKRALLAACSVHCLWPRLTTCIASEQQRRREGAAQAGAPRPKRGTADRRRVEEQWLPCLVECQHFSAADN